MEFRRVRAAGKAVAKLTNSGSKLTIKLPAGFLALHGLDPKSKLEVLYGAANRKSVLRIKPDDAGDWAFVTYGKGHHLRIPELAAKAEFKDVPLKAKKADGGLEFELPAPWELVDQDTVETA